MGCSRRSRLDNVVSSTRIILDRSGSLRPWLVAVGRHSQSAPISRFDETEPLSSFVVS
jgi:hypothetical protein